MIASSDTTANLKTQLERVIRRGRVLTAPAQLAGYDTDGLGYKTFRPDAVVLPADAEELIALMKESKRLNIPVTVRGAGTSLSGGPVAAQGGVVIHTSSLKKIRHISPTDFWCEVESSVVLNQLDAALLPYGLFYPPDPSSGPVCTLGGNVAMNAGGAHCFRYGVTSNYVLGLEVVLLDGSVHQFGGPAGGKGPWQEDWKRLMVGSEGTLGAFTRFWLRLLPRPEKVWTYRATFPELQSAERAIHRLSAHASFPVAIELMDPRCVALVENSHMAVGLPKDSFLIVTEIDGPESLVNARAQDVARVLQDSGATSVEFSDDESQRKKLWRARKVAGGLMGQMSPDFLVQDAVIPKRALAELLQLVYDEADAAGLPAVNVFHAGDGNLHPNFLFDSGKPGELEKVEAISKRLMQRVVEVGGTLSGEHGIGNDKTAYMPLVFGTDNLRLQLAVPKVFNPRHQLNPLKVFASRRFDSHKGDAHKGDSKHSDKRLPQHIETEDSKLAASPLFTQLFDPIDGVVCVPASAKAEDLQAIIGQHRLRYPFLLDDHTSLQQQLTSTGFAPASSRFGPFCDNIMGMNWTLPDGRVVRIGERVVKSTTGYDLLRFFLNSNGRFGTPKDVVLRLRPDCGASGVFWLDGSVADLSSAAASLLATCWIHWFDAVDLIFGSKDSGNVADGRLRLCLNCPEEEWAVYQSEVSRLAVAHSLKLHANTTQSTPFDGCPDFVLKTTPELAKNIAREIAAEHRIRCVALCHNGVVHGYLNTDSMELNRDHAGHDNADHGPSAAARIGSFFNRYATVIHNSGGDMHSRFLSQEPASPPETEWLNQLAEEFSAH